MYSHTVNTDYTTSVGWCSHDQFVTVLFRTRSVHEWDSFNDQRIIKNLIIPSNACLWLSLSNGILEQIVLGEAGTRSLWV